MNKINKQLQNAVNRLIELQDYNVKNDFNTREGKICANIKVYEYVGEYDIKKYIDDNQLQAYETQILDEFDEDRLNSIHEHVCEYETNYLKEKYEQNVDVLNFDKVFQIWHRVHNTENRNKDFYLNLYPQDKFYINEYWSEAKEFTSYKKWCNYVIKKSKSEYTDFSMRSKIDKIECWQYGRSGGWFSICDTDELDFSDIIYYNFGYWLEDLAKIDNNKDFNFRIKEEGENKKDLLFNINKVIRDAEKKIEAVQYIVNQIENSTKYFKDCLVNELEREIDIFIEDYLLPIKANCTIQIQDNLIKTSKGVTVDEQEFITRLNELKPKFKTMENGSTFEIKLKVGKYFVERATKTEDDVIIKAGCHNFSLNNLISVCG